MQYNHVKYNDRAFHETRRQSNRDLMVGRFKAQEESRMVTREAYGKRTAIFEQAVDRLARVNHKVRRTLDDLATGIGKPSFLCTTITDAITCTLNSIDDDSINPPAWRTDSAASLNRSRQKISYDQLFENKENDSDHNKTVGVRFARDLRAVLDRMPRKSDEDDYEPGQISARSAPSIKKAEDSSGSILTDITSRPRRHSKIENALELAPVPAPRHLKVWEAKPAMSEIQ